MNIRATLSDIRFSVDRKKTFSKMILQDESVETVVVAYDIVIDATLVNHPTIFVEKDGVRLIGSAYYSARNFRDVSDFKRNIYWMAWKLIRLARPATKWSVPCVMRFCIRHPDTSRIIMEPNVIHQSTPSSSLRYSAEPLRLKHVPPLRLKK